MALVLTVTGALVWILGALLALLVVVTWPRVRRRPHSRNMMPLSLVATYRLKGRLVGHVA